MEKIFVSAITIEEIYYGLTWKPNLKIAKWFNLFIKNHLEVVAVSDKIAARGGFIRGKLMAKGKPRFQADILIAATAIEAGLTLVTRNEKDFKGCGAIVFNPFS